MQQKFGFGMAVWPFEWGLEAYFFGWGWRGFARTTTSAGFTVGPLTVWLDWYWLGDQIEKRRTKWFVCH